MLYGFWGQRHWVDTFTSYKKGMWTASMPDYTPGSMRRCRKRRTNEIPEIFEARPSLDLRAKAKDLKVLQVSINFPRFVLLGCYMMKCFSICYLQELTTVRHRNIVSLYDCKVSQSFIHFLMQQFSSPPELSGF